MDQSNYHFQKLLHVIKDELAVAVANSVITALKHAENSSIEETGDEFLTVKDVCARFQISKSTIHNLRNDHKDFPIIRIGDSVRFKQSELEIFFKKSKK